MYFINHTRRTTLVAALVAAATVSLGAAGATAAGPEDAPEPAPTSIPADPAADIDDGNPDDPAATPVPSEPGPSGGDAPGPPASVPAEARTDARPPVHDAERPRRPDAVPTTAAAVAPSAPRSPTATAGNSLVKLSWLAPAIDGGAPVDTYAVEKAIYPNGPWYAVTTLTSTSYTASGLLNNSTWYFRIKAHNASGWGPPSAVVSAVPFSTPAEPHTLQGFPGDTSVTLTWYQPPTGGRPIDNYRVQRSQSLDGGWADLGTTPLRTFQDTGLFNGAKYYYRVAAHNEAGWGPYSWPINAVPRTVPNAPWGMTVRPVTSTSHDLIWQAPANGGALIDRYQVDRATSPNGPWDLLAHTTNPFYAATQLKLGTTYYYRIYAHNDAGWSPSSNVVSATTPKTAPSAPYYCSAVQVPAGPGYPNVFFDWNAPVSDGGSPIQGYMITVFRMGSGTYVKAIYTTDPNSFKYDSLPTGYFDIYIQAFNSVGYSPKCTTWLSVKL